MPVRYSEQKSQPNLPTKAQSSGSINTSTTDPFSQGIEINSDRVLYGSTAKLFVGNTNGELTQNNIGVDFGVEDPIFHEDVVDHTAEEYLKLLK